MINSHIRIDVPKTNQKKPVIDVTYPDGNKLHHEGNFHLVIFEKDQFPNVKAVSTCCASEFELANVPSLVLAAAERDLQSTRPDKREALMHYMLSQLEMRLIEMESK